MNFSEYFNVAMNERNMTNVDLSDKMTNMGFKISKESIGKYRNGSRTPDPSFIKLASDILHIEPNYLFGHNEKKVSPVPVVGTASCGGSDINHLQVDGMTCYFASESYHKDLYCVLADGESMSPEIDNGDQIVCDPTVTPEHGDLVHYKINGESAIKVLVENKEAGIISLKPINASENFKTRVLRVDDDEINELKMSKVVGINKINFNNKSARLRLVGE